MKLSKRITTVGRATMAVGLFAAGSLALSASPASAKDLTGDIKGKCVVNDYGNVNYDVLDASWSGDVASTSTGTPTGQISSSYVGDGANDRMSSFSVKCDMTQGPVIGIDAGVTYNCVQQVNRIGELELYRDANYGVRISPNYTVWNSGDIRFVNLGSGRGQCQSHTNRGISSLPSAANDQVSSLLFHLKNS